MNVKLTLILALAATAPLHAQVQDTASVPRELVQAIFSGMGSLRITVGEPPAGMPRDLLPAGRVVGGAVLYGDRVMVTVVHLDTTTGAAVEIAGAQAARLGWTRPEMSRAMRQGGFVPPEFDRRNDSLWCGDSASVQFSARRRRGGGSHLSVNYTPAIENTLCDARMADRRGSMMDMIDLPTMRLPEGMRAERMGSGGGTNYRESAASVRTDTSVAWMLDFFMDQLRADGWTTGTRLRNEEAGIATATKSAEDGSVTYARVVVTRTAAGTLDLALHVTVPGAMRGRSSRTTTIFPP